MTSNQDRQMLSIAREFDPTIIMIEMNHIRMSYSEELWIGHANGYSYKISADNLVELQMKFHDYLDPWRQYKEVE